jgi:lysyl endopeptidase
MKKAIRLFILLLYTNCLVAQINVGNNPFSLENPTYQINIPIITMPALNMTTINADDLIDKQQNQPPRFGFAHIVTYNIVNSGVIKTLPNGDKLWQLKINCTNAKSINFVFSQFHLSPRAVLHIYNPTTNKKIGGFTAFNNKGTFSIPKKLTTGLVYGNNVVIELRMPATELGSNKLQIENIIQGYRFIYVNQNHLKSYGSSGLCQININCPDGYDKQNQKKGIALILVNGNRICTGSLINNTSNNKEPYLLTAHHCLKGKDAQFDSDASNFSFIWEYEEPYCPNGSILATVEPPKRITSGATVIANNLQSDFALLKLKENPLSLMPPVETYYNGWDRTVTPTSGGYGIHHPSADVKKISIYQQTPTSNHNCADLNTWSVIFLHPSGSYTVTEGGSSGSPLFTNNHRIIGQLLGGFNNLNCQGGPECLTPQNDMSQYGKFSVSWNNLSSNFRRLSVWLDPTNTNLQFIDGLLGNNCNITYVTNQTLNNPPITQDCKIISANSIANSGGIDFQVSKESILSSDFEVKNGAEFEIKTW